MNVTVVIVKSRRTSISSPGRAAYLAIRENKRLMFRRATRVKLKAGVFIGRKTEVCLNSGFTMDTGSRFMYCGDVVVKHSVRFT